MVRVQYAFFARDIPCAFSSHWQLSTTIHGTRWHWSSIVFEPLQPVTFIRHWQRLLQLDEYLYRSLRVKTCWKRKGCSNYQTVKTSNFQSDSCLVISQVFDQNIRSHFSVVVCICTIEDDACQTALQTTKQWGHQGQCLVFSQSSCFLKMQHYYRRLWKDRGRRFARLVMLVRPPIQVGFYQIDVDFLGYNEWRYHGKKAYAEIAILSFQEFNPRRSSSVL